jgi:hypothetical protein
MAYSPVWFNHHCLQRLALNFLRGSTKIGFTGPAGFLTALSLGINHKWCDGFKGGGELEIFDAQYDF